MTTPGPVQTPSDGLCGAETIPGTPKVPAKAPVSGAVLLETLRTALCRYVVLPSPEASDSVVLWIAATHAQPAFEHATRLVITGPAKRCGKSRLLDVVKETAHDVLPAVHASTAALYRSIGGGDPPTILFDEADTIFGTRKAAEANEDLRALINAGFARGWPILRCVGPDQKPTPFHAFAMAALAGIGTMPDTITDRAVNIRMRRRAEGETVAPFRIGRDAPPLNQLRDQLTDWARTHLDQLRDAAPDMPVEDRAADTWESLIALADLAGGDWPDRARLACKLLTAQAADEDTDTSTATRLLADLRIVFTATDQLYTRTVLERLHQLTDSPWADMQLSASDLAKILRPFGIKPVDVRENGGANRKGYKTATLADTWRRYLPQPPP